MDCPRCGLVNPGEAQRCDCGYDFATRTLQASYLEKPRRRSRGLSSGWVVAIVVVAVSSLLSRFTSPRNNVAGVGELLRQSAYKELQPSFASHGAAWDETRGFVDRWHDDCLREAAGGRTQLLLPIVKPKYLDCLRRALRDEHKGP